MVDPPSNFTLSRLRRALAGHCEDENFVYDVVERAVASLLEGMPAGSVALLESIIDNFARAAEQLGPDASVQEIAALAHEIERRPN